MDELHQQRLAALKKVTTPFAIFLDDTDCIPDDIPITKIEADLARNGIVHFDTLVAHNGKHHLMQGDNWSADWHRAHPTAIHNAVISMNRLETVFSQIPHGLFWTEFVLYFALAHTAGSVYIPLIGYHWNPTNGMHQHSSIHMAIKNSVQWSKVFEKSNPSF